MDEERKTDREVVHLDEAGASQTSSPVSQSVRVTRVVTSKPWILLIVAVLVVSAVVVAMLLGRRSSSEEGRPVPTPTGVPVPSPSNQATSGTQPQAGDITITLSPDKIESAQIKTEMATEQAGEAAPDTGGMRTTGVVQSNAYKETPVFPIAGGIIRQVNAELGDRVRRGQPLVVIFSTELAEAQGEYIKMLAELEEHHQHHRRATELVEIGAMSREELEQATSKYKAAGANVSTARQRLILLGMTSQQVDALRTPSQVQSLVSVPAPTSGTVLNRAVNAGEVIDKGKEIFRVADLSTVWVMGQVYEGDFAKVRIGTPAVISTPAYAGRNFTGKVSYIDPRVDPNTRTAQVRVEVANPGEALRLGMFVDVSFGGTAPAVTNSQPVVVIPREAVQAIGSKQVVFVATTQPGVFIQRDVSVGPEDKGFVPVYSGVKAGERVVTEGSFLLRAESLKLNPAQSTSSNAQPASPNVHAMPQSAQPQQPESAQRQRAEPAETRQDSNEQNTQPKIQAVRVVVTKDGFKPASFTVRKDIPVQLTFVRQVEVTCVTEVVIPNYNIRRELPLKEPVLMEFTPTKTGNIGFACGMNMQRGNIVVR